MVTNSQSVWWPRGMTLLVWAVLAASLAFWWLKLVPGVAPSGAPVPEPVAAAPAPPADPAALARLLGGGGDPAGGGAPVLGAAPGRLTLVGVVAGRSSRGAALIAVDGKPPRPYRVGTKIEEGLFLQSVAPRRAVLAAAPGGPATLTLDMPPLKP